MNATMSPVLIVLTDPTMSDGARLLERLAAAVMVTNAAGPASADPADPAAWSVAEAWSWALTEAWGYAFDAIPDELRHLL